MATFTKLLSYLDIYKTYIFSLLSFSKYLNETIVYSGTTPTLIPSLSAKTFNFDTTAFTYNNISNNLGYYRKRLYNYEVRLSNPLDIRDFEIYGSYITGQTFGPSILIYGYTGATSSSTIYDSNFFI